MKKLLYTIACSFIAINGFSQNNFKQIDFSQIKTTSGTPSLLDYGIYANKNATNNLKVDVTKKTGTININVKDSVITVKMDGSEDKFLKFPTFLKKKKLSIKRKRIKN